MLCDISAAVEGVRPLTVLQRLAEQFSRQFALIFHITWGISVKLAFGGHEKTKSVVQLNGEKHQRGSYVDLV